MRMRNGRPLVAIAVMGALLVSTSGCALIGVSQMSQQETKQTNLDNQRTVAFTFWRYYTNPELTAIRFSDEGGRPALGAGWRVGAYVTVGGKEYGQVFTKTSWLGDRMPDRTEGATPMPITVLYSDGSREVLHDNR